MYPFSADRYIFNYSRYVCIFLFLHFFPIAILFFFLLLLFLLYFLRKKNTSKTIEILLPFEIRVRVLFRCEKSVIGRLYFVRIRCYSVPLSPPPPHCTCTSRKHSPISTVLLTVWAETNCKIAVIVVFIFCLLIKEPDVLCEFYLLKLAFDHHHQCYS